MQRIRDILKPTELYLSMLHRSSVVCERLNGCQFGTSSLLKFLSFACYNQLKESDRSVGSK